jgi:hypothetical protein
MRKRINSIALILLILVLGAIAYSTSAGITPTTVNGRSLTISLRPITSRAAP